MENIISRGAPNIPYPPEMSYQQQPFTHRRSEDNLVERNNSSAPDLYTNNGRGNISNEEIASDHHLPTNPASNTEKQLNLSDEIYGLKWKAYNMEVQNLELRKEVQLVKEQNSMLIIKLNGQVIVDLKNYEEEKRQWKLEREEFESKENMYNGVIRGLNEDKVHLLEKISMLEMNLARPIYYPPAQPVQEYHYSPRDAMNTRYSQGNSVQDFDSSYFTGHSPEIAAYGQQSTSPYPQEYSRVLHPITAPAIAYDPVLTCDICGAKFLYGEIQKAKDHLNTVHPTNN